MRRSSRPLGARSASSDTSSLGHPLAFRGDGRSRERTQVDACRRLSDDVHAPARHHDRRRRVTEHPAALRRQPDRFAMGGRRLRAHPRHVDSHRGGARRQVRAPAGLHDGRRALHLRLAALRPRVEHDRPRRCPCAARHRRRCAFRNGARAHRPRVPRSRAIRRARHLGRHRRRCGRLRTAHRGHPYGRARVAVDLLRQHSGGGLRTFGGADADLGVPRRGSEANGCPGPRYVLGGALLDRLRNPPRKRSRLVERTHPVVARRRSAPTAPVRPARAPSGASDARRDALPPAGVRRRFRRDVLHRCRDVLDVPVPLDLPAGHPRVLAARRRPALPAADSLRLLRPARDPALCGTRAAARDDRRRADAGRGRPRVDVRARC